MDPFFSLKFFKTKLLDQSFCITKYVLLSWVTTELVTYWYYGLNACISKHRFYETVLNKERRIKKVTVANFVCVTQKSMHKGRSEMVSLTAFCGLHYYHGRALKRYFVLTATGHWVPAITQPSCRCTDAVCKMHSCSCACAPTHHRLGVTQEEEEEKRIVKVSYLQIFSKTCY